MSNERELDELVAKLALYDDRLSMDCRRVITALRQERDMHYNRVASLLFSDALKDARTTCEEVRKWESEYIDARAENERLRALLQASRNTLELWTPDESNASSTELALLNAWYALRGRIDAALRREET
jgi:hypothetical protein